MAAATTGLTYNAGEVAARDAFYGADLGAGAATSGGMGALGTAGAFAALFYGSDIARGFADLLTGAEDKVGVQVSTGEWLKVPESAAQEIESMTTWLTEFAPKLMDISTGTMGTAGRVDQLRLMDQLMKDLTGQQLISDQQMTAEITEAMDAVIDKMEDAAISGDPAGSADQYQAQLDMLDALLDSYQQDQEIVQMSQGTVDGLTDMTGFQSDWFPKLTAAADTKEVERRLRAVEQAVREQETIVSVYIGNDQLDAYIDKRADANRVAAARRDMGAWPTQ